MILKRVVTFVSLIASCCVAASGQNYFQKSYNETFTDQVQSMTELPGGNLVMAGYVKTDPATDHRDIWLTCVKKDGAMIWSKTIPLPQSSQASAIETSADGNLILVYNTFGNTATDYTSGWMKLDPGGNILWAKKAIANSLLTNVRAMATGGYVLCGHNVTVSNGNITGLVVRIDENGNIQWSSVFGENGASMVADCWEDSFGFIYCCGTTSQIGGDKNGFWAKLDGIGQLVLPVRKFGSSQTDELTRIVPMGADRMLLCGYSNGFSNSAYTSIWAVVTNFSGDYQYSHIFSLTETDLVTGDLINYPGDQFVLAAGTLPHPITPAILVKFDLGLNQLFAYHYKGGQESDQFSRVLATGNGLAAAGVTKANGDANAYLVAVNANGQLDDADCCPKGVEIVRTDATPQTASFVPTQTAFFSVQNLNLQTVPATPAVRELCEPILVTFTLSIDTICPMECVDIVSQDSTQDVVYSFDIVGGSFDPDMPNRICHQSGTVLQITRKGMNHNCEKSFTRTVTLGAKKDNFPNAFTPNGDGSNDVFRPLFGCPAVSMNLQVYSRWGQKVFETADPNGGWDGRIDGKDAISDVYVWKLDYEVEINGSREKMHENGQIVLLR